MRNPEDLIFELHPDLEDIIQDGLMRFQRAIEEKGLVLTEELKRQFTYEMSRTASQLTGTITFRGYGRFKDMARISYLKHAPPLEAMEAFVDKVGGVGRFAYVPGYKDKRIPTTGKAELRIAWALARSRRRVPSIKRGYRGTWYNSSKMDMINAARRTMGQRYGQLVAEFIAKGIGEDADS